ncbi:unnamed protein product [Caenorhabditis brenneri]
MSQSSLLLLLLIFGCCSAYMRKQARAPGFVVGRPYEEADQRFVESNPTVELNDKAKKYERVLNAVVASGNRPLVAALFEPSFKFYACEPWNKGDLEKEAAIEFVLKHGENYSFKILDWLEWEDTSRFNATVSVGSEARYTWRGSLSRFTHQLVLTEFLNCPNRSEKPATDANVPAISASDALSSSSSGEPSRLSFVVPSPLFFI